MEVGHDQQMTPVDFGVYTIYYTHSSVQCCMQNRLSLEGAYMFHKHFLFKIRLTYTCNYVTCFMVIIVTTEHGVQTNLMSTLNILLLIGTSALCNVTVLSLMEVCQFMSVSDQTIQYLKIFMPPFRKGNLDLPLSIRESCLTHSFERI